MRPGAIPAVFRVAAAACCLLLAAGWASAQAAAGSTAVSTSAVSTSAGPGETEELVIPPIVLEIEDLSVVRIEARLPPEEDLLPPELAIPLPEAGELRVGEPSLPSAGLIDGGAAGTGAAGGQALSSQISLGAGTASTVSALVKLGTAADSPVSLTFSHESLDGFGGRPAGAGFGSRSDLLDGSVRLEAGRADATVTGSFADDEVRLQGQSPYGSRSLRTIEGGARISASPAGWLTLGAGVDGGVMDHTLTATVPVSMQELRVQPSVEAAATFGAVTIGLTADYGFHAGSFGPEHRFDAATTLAIELSSAWSVDGAVGWHWASPDAPAQSLSVFPFHVGLTGVVADVLTFTLRGGYRATPIDFGELMAARPLLEAALKTRDSVGWFGETSLSVGLSRGIAANLGASFATESAMLDLQSPVAATDPLTGLFAVTQRPATRLTLQAGARWSPAAWFTLTASGSFEVLDRPLWEPALSLDIEGSAIAASGALGGRLSAGLRTTSANVLEAPEIDLGGFLRVSPSVRLRLDALDLLAPLASPRIDLGPYLRPGLRVTAAAEITL